MFAATGEERYREEARSAMRSYIRRLDNPKGRWNKLLPGTPARLSLGSFMILANLGCVMKECLATGEFDAETDGRSGRSCGCSTTRSSRSCSRT